MRRWVERAIEWWLRRVVPSGWADSIFADLREDGRAGALWPQAAIAARFTLEALSSWRPRRPRWGTAGTGGPMLATEIRHACRALWRSPGFTATAVLTLALAIGANTAIYSALRSIVLHPLPFPDSDRLVFVWHRNAGMGGMLLTPPRTAIARWRALTGVFESLESFDSRSLIVEEGGEPAEVRVTFLDPSTLRMLGAAPRIGRDFVEADTAPGAPPVLLISHEIWLERFKGVPEVIGRALSLNGTPYTVIGVMPPGFDLPMGSDALWAAAGSDRAGTARENTIGKLRPGVTLEQAQQALDSLGSADADDDRKGWSGYLLAPRDHHGTYIHRALYVLAGAVALLLLLACVNVANLVLSRNAARRRELAVRRALGVSRGRLIRHVLVEAVILAGGGAVAGLLVSRWCLDLIRAIRPANLEALDRVTIDGAALAFLGVASLVTTVLFGLAPAISASRFDLQAVLKTGSPQATPSGLRVRRALAVAQVALALMLVIGATLLLRSYGRLTAVDPGFDPEGVIAVRLDLPAHRYPARDLARREQFFDDVLSRARELPGVASAAFGNGIPPETGVMFGRTLEVHGRTLGDHGSLLSGAYVSPDYFTTLGIPIREGRAFSTHDTEGSEPVVIVGQAFARQVWRGASPLGARLRTQSNEAWATIVGVVPDVASPDRTWPQIYFPRAQARPGWGSLIIRADGDPLALLPAIKAAVWASDPQLPVQDIDTAGQVLRRTTSGARFNMALLASFAACGLLLAVVGVYGVMTLFVGQRQRELGIRMALGASRGAVALLVFRQSAVVLLSGIVIGTLGAAWLATFLQSLLYETAPRDAGSFAAASAAIALAAAAATIAPIVRARRVDPTTLLRAE